MWSLWKKRHIVHTSVLFSVTRRGMDCGSTEQHFPYLGMRVLKNREHVRLFHIWTWECAKIKSMSALAWALVASSALQQSHMAGSGGPAFNSKGQGMTQFVAKVHKIFTPLAPLACGQNSWVAAEEFTLLCHIWSYGRSPKQQQLVRYFSECKLCDFAKVYFKKAHWNSI